MIRKTTQKEKFASLPKEKVYLDVDEDKRFCQKCGTALERIGEEFVRREIEIVKPSVKIIEYYSVNYGWLDSPSNIIIRLEYYDASENKYAQKISFILTRQGDVHRIETSRPELISE